MTVHAILGASSAHRWMACPGSVRLIAKLIAQGYNLNRETSYAHEGSGAHELAAHCLRTSQDAHALIDTWVLTETPNPIQVTEEMAEAVQVYLDYVRGLAMEGRGTLFFIEQLFDLGKFREGLFGTTDCAAYQMPTRTLHIVDYKHGAGVPVEAIDNPQTKYYGLGGLLKLQSMGLTETAPDGTKRPMRLPERIVLTIVQPRAFHPDGPVRSESMSSVALIEWADRLIEAAEATDKENAPLVPGTHCRFCPAVSRCPQLYQDALNAAQLVFADVPEPMPHHMTGPTPVAKLSDEQFRRALMAATVLEPWFKELWATAQSKLEAGEHIDGWKLVQKVARRKWGVDDFLIAAELGKHGLDRGLIYETTLRSPAQVEELLTNRKVPPAERKKLLDPFVVKESSGVTLVPAADKRPAISKPLPFEVLPEE